MEIPPTDAGASISRVFVNAHLDLLNGPPVQDLALVTATVDSDGRPD
jgi:hypothetical protein